MKFGFWAYQPVFHSFNLTYKIKERGIINHDLPTVNKYCNFLNVISTEFEERKEEIFKEIYDNKLCPYNPTLSNFLSYFAGNNSKTFISTYHQPAISGILTSRPLNITLKNQKSFIVYFIDHLCINTEYTKTITDIENELFQTHEYNIRNKNRNIRVSLFKRREKIPGLVELTAYITYSLHITSIPKVTLLHPSMKLIEINKLNLNLLTTFVFNQKPNFDCFALPDITNLVYILNNDTYKIYGIIENDKLIACYFFRIVLSHNNGYKNINVFASISNCNNSIFINGFIKAIHKYAKKLKVEQISVDNISHNNIIINYFFSLNILLKFENQSAYYFYNYAKKPLLSEKVFMVC